ncbi:hypothetical protein TNCV_2310431 [Trichonephila clavipes]|nr:hypothetical protein TNCV_2310431 [Trichonephila clavipes]
MECGTQDCGVRQRVPPPTVLAKLKNDINPNESINSRARARAFTVQLMRCKTIFHRSEERIVSTERESGQRNIHISSHSVKYFPSPGALYGRWLKKGPDTSYCSTPWPLRAPETNDVLKRIKPVTRSKFPDWRLM